MVFGYKARAPIAQTGQEGRGPATAGIVPGWVGITLTLLVITFVILVISSRDEPFPALL